MVGSHGNGGRVGGSRVRRGTVAAVLASVVVLVGCAGGDSDAAVDAIDSSAAALAAGWQVSDPPDTDDADTLLQIGDRIGALADASSDFGGELDWCRIAAEIDRVDVARRLRSIVCDSGSGLDWEQEGYVVALAMVTVDFVDDEQQLLTTFPGTLDADGVVELIRDGGPVHDRAVLLANELRGERNP